MTGPATEVKAQHSSGSDCRALALVAPAAGSGRPGEIRQDAGFLTQLLASRAGMGPYRRYRRAEPEAASRSYAERERSDGVVILPRGAISA